MLFGCGSHREITSHNSFFNFYLIKILNNQNNQLNSQIQNLTEMK